MAQIKLGKDANGRTIYKVGSKYFYTREKAETFLPAKSNIYTVGTKLKSKLKTQAKGKAKTKAKTKASSRDPNLFVTKRYPHSLGTGLAGARKQFAGRGWSKAQVEERAREILTPVWAMGACPKLSGPAYLSAFEGVYYYVDGPLTKSKAMKALKASLHAIGGADHRYIERIDKTRAKFEGLPVYAIVTGS